VNQYSRALFFVFFPFFLSSSRHLSCWCSSSVGGRIAASFRRTVDCRLTALLLLPDFRRLTFPFRMNPVPFPVPPPAQQPPPWMPMLPPNPPLSSGFWENRNVHERLRELQETLVLAQEMQKELEVLAKLKPIEESGEDKDMVSDDRFSCLLSKCLEGRKIGLATQEHLSTCAANALMVKLRAQLEPLQYAMDETTPWEEKAASIRLSDRLLKSKRNKQWRKRKRKHVAEMHAKEHRRFVQADREADEWRGREIAKEAAQLKVESMNSIAKLKAKEERKKLESELELVLMVEKLQELRSLRIQKLKKQGHFLPEEDDKFLEKVQAAVEEEERLAQAAAETNAAKDAIASAEESRKTIHNHGSIPKEARGDDVNEDKPNIDLVVDAVGSSIETFPSRGKGPESHSHGGAFGSAANLPIEFYHYYHGSNNDMGTLIEVRRTWDAYIRPGGRITQDCEFMVSKPL
ncbi:U11/U12 small nuclear ribonucleoprotein 59 kDa protein, partial [Linum grandiflorum]